jgi:hypothetical protein
MAIDADYENALEDLLKLQWEVRQEGVEQPSKSPVTVLNSGSSPTSHCLQGTGQAGSPRGEERGRTAPGEALPAAGVAIQFQLNQEK